MQTTPVTASVNVKTPTVSHLQSSIASLDIVIPDGEQYDLSIDVETPYDSNIDKSYFRLCKVAVVSAGDNVACVSRDEPKYLAQGGNKVPSYTSLDLGRVTNTGMIDGKKNKSANVIRVEIVVTPLDKIVASQYTVKMKVNYGKQKSLPMNYDVTVTSSSMTLPVSKKKCFTHKHAIYVKTAFSIVILFYFISSCLFSTQLLCFIMTNF